MKSSHVFCALKYDESEQYFFGTIIRHLEHVHSYWLKGTLLSVIGWTHTFQNSFRCFFWSCHSSFSWTLSTSSSGKSSSIPSRDSPELSFGFSSAVPPGIAPWVFFYLRFRQQFVHKFLENLIGPISWYSYKTILRLPLLAASGFFPRIGFL